MVTAAVVLIGAGVAVWLVSRPPSAEAVAEDYLRALAAGDAARIDELLDDGDEHAELALKALSGADSYISGYSFEVSPAEAGMRTVRADVTLGGEPGIVGFTLTERDGRWLVGSDYLAELTAQTSIGDSVRVGGVLAPAGVPVALLPALYPVTAAPAGLTTGEASAVVTNQSPVTVTIDAAFSPAAVEAAQQQLDGYADGCAKPGTQIPPNCGLRIPWAADLATMSSVAFRIDAYPAVILAEDGRTFAATDGDIVATVSGTTRAGGPGTFTYRADDWALRGSVTFRGDEMTLAVR